MNFKKLMFLIAIPIAISVKANVVIIGKIIGTKAGELQIQKNSPFLTDFIPTVLYSSNISSAKSIHIDLPIDRAQLITFYFSSTGVNQEIFVSPGDKVNFIIDTNGLRFFGANQGAYNFLSKMSLAIDGRKRPNFKNYADFFSYKEALRNWFAKKRDFLSKYIKINHLSKQAAKFFKDDMDYEYNLCLNSPLSAPGTDRKKIPAGYLDSSAAFNKDYLLNGNSFYGPAAIMNYLHVAVADPYGHCGGVYKNAVQKLKGKTRDYFVNNMIGLFVENAPQQNKEELAAIITAEKAIIKDAVYLEYIKKQEVKLLMLNHSLPDTVLDRTVLTDYQGGQLPLRQILEMNSGKALYIDFWASWCVPCREDIKNSASAKALMDEKGAKYIYLSVDKDRKQWEKAVGEEKIENNQFLVHDDFKSPLGALINVFYIPRYIYLDEDHKVTNIYAPRPTEINELKKMLNPLKVIRYE